MLRAEAVKFQRGGEVLFENLNFDVHAGQRVAIAGRNGVGKSTLFQLILGELQTDAGQISFPRDWRVAHMRQEVDVTERVALEFVIDGDQELRATEAAIANTEDPERLAELHARLQDLGGYEATARAGEILYGLGFSSADLEKPFSAFSGGWRIRLNLAQALMARSDLLLLDEPTNHLDLETIIWLERWLLRFPGTVLIIAHDRAFLDACAQHTLYLSGNTGRLYAGNYSSCERQRAERAILEQARQTKQAQQAAHIQKFVDRFRAKSSKAKQVQSRIKALERMEDIAIIHAESPYSIHFQNPDKVSNPLFSLREIEVGYNQQAVLKQVSLTLLPGARVGVLGANGAGKSTLLKAFVGDLSPLNGDFHKGQNSDVGYFAQHQLETLHGTNTPLATLAQLQTTWREQQCRDYLGGWGFTAGMTTRRIDSLSGGEKARLVLALIAVEYPAVLILDEPTNHLDLDMRDALALALQDYEGAVVIVSHDRDLLEKTVDEFWFVQNGGVGRFQGDLEDYAALQTQPKSKPHTGGREAQDISVSGSKKAQRQERAHARAQLKGLRDQARKLEKTIERDNVSLSEIESRLADKETYDTLAPDELDDLLKKSARLRKAVEENEEAWLEVLEQLEATPEG